MTADLSGQKKEPVGFLLGSVAHTEQYRSDSALNILVHELLIAYRYFILKNLEKKGMPDYTPPVEQIKTKLSNYQDKHIKFPLTKC